MKKALFFCIISFIIDRLTKIYALTNIAAPIKIAPLFYLYPVTNTGVAWGLFRNFPAYFIIGWTGALTTVLAIYTAYQYHTKQPYFLEALILTGALSNIIDRLFGSGVIDFIIFSTGRWSFPAFNIADALIFIGAAGRIMSNLLITRRRYQTS